MEGNIFTERQKNTVRVHIGILDHFTNILRDVLSVRIPANDLYNNHVAGKYKTSGTGRTLGLWEDIFLGEGHLELIKNATDYNEFDITLLYISLRNFCTWATHEKPSKGWGINEMPDTEETTIGDDIERIRILRNRVYAHKTSFEMSDEEYIDTWPILVNICERMERHINGSSYHQDIQNLEEQNIQIESFKNVENQMKQISLELLSNKYGIVLEIHDAIERQNHDLKKILTWFKRAYCHVIFLFAAISIIVAIVVRMHMDGSISKADRATENKQRKILEEWQNEDEKFYRTRACQEAERIIESANTLTIIGNSGSGKTAIAQHIALRYQREGYRVISATNFHDVFSKMDPAEKQIFVLNDPVGQEVLDEIKDKNMVEYQEQTQKILKNSTIKLIFTCRKVVFNDKRLKCKLLTSSTVEIDGGRLSLSQSEKKEILGMYVKLINIDNDDISYILKTDHYFPLLCSLFGNKKNFSERGIDLFKDFVGFITKELEYFRSSDKEKYCALVLMSSSEQEASKELYELCGLPNDNPKSLLGELSTLKGSYVKQFGTSYRFSHDYLKEVTTFVTGSANPFYMIKHYPSNFVLTRLVCYSSKSNNMSKMGRKRKNLIVEIDEQYIPVLVERLFSEIMKGNYFQAFLSPCLREKYVINEFITKLNNTLIDKLISMHSNDHKNQQHGFRDRTFIENLDFLFLNNTRVSPLRQLLREGKFTKLDFLTWDNKKVSPLHHLVIYNHEAIVRTISEKTDMSKLKEYELFPASCASGNTELIKYIMNKFESSVHDKWNGNLTCIQIAALFNHNGIIQFLLEEHKGDANYLSYGWTPLSLATLNRFESDEKRQNAVIKTLIDNGADVNKLNSDASGPLYYAAYKGYDSIVNILLDKNAKVNIKNKKGESPLYIAAMKGFESTLKILLKHKANVNMPNKESATPLHIAAEKGHDSVVKALLDKKARVNACNHRGASPLYIATEKGHDSVVKILLDYKADFQMCNFNSVRHFDQMRLNNIRDDRFAAAFEYFMQTQMVGLVDASPLHIAARRGHYSIARMLLNIKVDVNMRDNNGESPLYIAARNGHDSVVQMLMDNKADVNMCNKDGVSPLHTAAQLGHFSIVRMLIDKKANVNKLDNDGASPLYMAAMNEPDYAKILMDKKEDVNIFEGDGVKPLYIAAQQGHYSIVSMLLNNKADVNMRDKRGVSPLYIASRYAHESVIKILLEHKADVNMCDNNGVGPLYIASQRGHYAIVSMLLDKEADVNKCNNKRESPLYIAAYTGHNSIVKILLDKKANTNLCNIHGASPLYVAAMKGFESVVNTLLDNNANVSKCNKNGLSPLYIAAKNGHDSIVKILLKYKSEVDMQDNDDANLPYKQARRRLDFADILMDSKADLSLFYTDDASPLHVAARRGHFSIVKILLENNADLNMRDNKGASPLYIGAMNGRDSVVKILLEKEADIDMCDNNGASPLYQASTKGHDSVVKILLGYKAKIDMCDNNGASPLYKATENGHYSTVKVLLENKADHESFSIYRVRPLHVAAQGGHYSIVKLLLEKKAEVNIRDQNGASPLYKAAMNGHESVAKILLDNKADVNIHDNYSATSLYKASENGHDFVVKILLENKADINMSDNNGISPLYIASKNGYYSVVKILLDNNADVNMRDQDGISPLYIAVKEGHDSVVKLLLDNKAEVNMSDNYGISPLYVAAKNGYYSIVKMLLDNKADVNMFVKNGNSPLHISAHSGYYAVVQTLLNHKVDVNMCNKNGSSAINIAEKNKRESVFKLLLDNEAKRNICDNSGA